MRVSGRNARSVDDVEVRLAADLKDAQPMHLPVLSQIRSFVPGIGVSAAASFAEGRIEARLRRGVVQISRLSIANRQLRIYVTGQVNTAGRLDLDAVVASGRGNDPVLAQLVLRRLVAVASAPAGALLLANDYLSNRVVHLTIRGTLWQPIIQVKPFATLQEEAVRFFLRRSSGSVSR